MRSLTQDSISFHCLNNPIRHWLHNLQTDFSCFCDSQVLEVVALLTDDYELLDWRRFLLCAALPWPVPSLSQLLVVLQRFRSTDAEHTGYINETEYSQVSFYTSVQPTVKSVVLYLRISFCTGLNCLICHQTELWFSRESVQPVPEDPSEPLPYNRLTNLHKVKYFIQLLEKCLEVTLFLV